MESPEEFFTDETHILYITIGASAMGCICCLYKCFCK